MKTIIITIFMSFSLLMVGQKETYNYLHGIKFVSQHAVFFGPQKMNGYEFQNKKIVYEYNLLAHGKHFNHGGGYSIVVGLRGKSKINVQAIENDTYYNEALVNVDGDLTYGYGGASIFYKFNKYFIGNYYDGGLYADLGVRIIFALTNTSFKLPIGYDLDYSSIDNSNYIYNRSASYFTTHFATDAKIGYSIPLDKINISPFVGLQKSLITLVGDSDKLVNSDFGFISFHFGVSFTILNPVRTSWH